MPYPMNFHSHKKRMLRFLSISLFIHGIIIAYASQSLILSGHEHTILTVQLAQTDNKISKTVMQLEHRSKTNPTSRPYVQDKTYPLIHTTNAENELKILKVKREHVTANYTFQNNENFPLKKENMEEDSAIQNKHSATYNVSTASKQDRLTKAQIQSLLLSQLARHFNYPAVARQRGWQGKVLLGFDVESDGSLKKIHIAHSSGYSVLDHSAMDSLAQIENITDNRILPSVKIVDMQIPVIYRLQE